MDTSVATNSFFCERIVPRIPESRSNDYSSVFYIHVSAVHTKNTQMVLQNLLDVCFWQKNRTIYYVAVIHDKHMAKKFHNYFSDKFLAKFQDVLPAYFCCDIISQGDHVTLHWSVDELPMYAEV